MGTSTEHTRPTGASRFQNARSIMRALISAEIPPDRHPSSMITARRVLESEVTYSGVVQRTQCPQVQHFGLDLLSCEHPRCFQRLVQRTAVSDKSNVFSFSPDRQPVDIDSTCISLQFTCHIVEQDVLENQDRIGILKRGPQHATHIFEGRRR